MAGYGERSCHLVSGLYLLSLATLFLRPSASLLLTSVSFPHRFVAFYGLRDYTLLPCRVYT